MTAWPEACTAMYHGRGRSCPRDLDRNTERITSMKSGWLSLIAIGLIAVGSSASTACAHSSYGVPGHVMTRRGDPGWQRDAYNRGYRDGRRDGERDARRGRRPNWGDRRWNARDESRRAYEQGYREGYRASFARYDRSGRWGRDPSYGRGAYGRGGIVPPYPGPSRSYRSPAASRGYEDGYKDGRDTARKRDRYDPRLEKKYRKGDDGYKDAYGSKDDYRAEYRNAFRAGYDAGYREAC